jgi:hypothetical protein
MNSIIVLFCAQRKYDQKLKSSSRPVVECLSQHQKNHEKSFAKKKEMAQRFYERRLRAEPRYQIFPRNITTYMPSNIR